MTNPYRKAPTKDEVHLCIHSWMGNPPHFFRHAHASHALDNGAPIHVVQQSLGHANVATTSRYLHVRPNQGASQFLSV